MVPRYLGPPRPISSISNMYANLNVAKAPTDYNPDQARQYMPS